MRTFTIPCLWSLLLAGSTFAALENDRYRLEPQSNGTVRLHAGAVAADFAPTFTVLYRAEDPRLALRPNRVPGVSYSVETWFTGKTSDGPIGNPVDLARTVGDGWDPSILAGDQEGRTADLFASGISRRIQASRTRSEHGVVQWDFSGDAGFILSATLTLPAGAAEPVLRVTFTPGRAGWYSVGYTGAPAVGADAVEELFQPPLWTRQRVPVNSFITSAFRCTVPSAIAASGGRAWGVAADPAMLPFQPLPLLTNSQFAVVLRNPQGEVQPMVFAPVLGGAGSRRNAGETLTFDLRPFVRVGGAHGAFEHLARGLMQVRDYRRNDFVSLNQTLANILDYAFTPFGRFDEDLRGSAYDTDVPGTVNNVTGLHPFSLALLTDDERIYWRRAVPMFEAGLSRSKMLFTTDPAVKGQGATWKLEGPNMRGSESAVWYGLTGRRVPWLRQQAEESANSWLRSVALYRATGERAWLQRAVSGARIALETLGEQAREMKGIGFWTTPMPWIALWDLYEASGDDRFRQAALEGAREYLQFIWMGPVIPAGDITVNPGGQAPLYWYMSSKGKQPMATPEARVPAWRLSEIGLTSESAPTSGGHRGIFLAMPSPALLRIGQATGNGFLHDVARAGIVGRSANFPGYHMNTARSDVYEKADYPLRTLHELSYNSFHYNHVWPHAAMLVDYLVTDLHGRSRGQVSFPGEYAEGYGYLQTRVYGGAPGRFFDQAGAWPWLPLDAVAVDNVEINWLAARTPGGLGLSFANQSPERQRFTVKLDASQIPSLAGTTIEALRWNGPDSAAPVTVRDGVVSLEVPPMGLVSLRIPGISIDTKFAQRVGRGRGAQSGRAEVDFPDGGGRAYLMSAGENLTHAYVFVRATAQTFTQVRLQHRAGGQWQTAKDEAYPFEFSIRVPDGRPFEFKLEGVRPDGTIEGGTVQLLK